MIEFYHRMFYHLYKLAIKSGEKSAPLSSVVPTLVFLQIANAFCILMILDMVGLKILSNFLSNKNMKAYLIVISVLLMGLNYYYFTSKDRGKSIVKKLSKKSVEERKRGAKITLVYALVSIALIFVLAPLRVM